jgi:hypothetical protein
MSKPDRDYPRMLFHPRKQPVTVGSAEEEKALGAEWSRTIHPPAPEASHEPAAPAEPGGPADQVEALHRVSRARSHPTPEPEPDPEPDPEPEPKPATRPPAKPPAKRPPAAAAKKRR